MKQHQINNKKFKYWTTFKDLPKNIQMYIQKQLDTIYFSMMPDDKELCSTCLNELDINHKCVDCNKDYMRCVSLFSDELGLAEKYGFSTIIPFYVFDIIDNEVILYKIDTLIRYNHLGKHVYYVISNAYHIMSDKCEDLVDDRIYSYSNFDEILNQQISLNLPKELEECYKYKLVNFDSFIYTNNLDDLKDTIYKNSYIWELEEQFKQMTEFDLKMLILYPIYFKQFGTLVKEKQYDLALFYLENKSMLYKHTLKSKLGIKQKF